MMVDGNNSPRATSSVSQRGKRSIDDLFEQVRQGLIKSERNKPPHERHHFICELAFPTPPSVTNSSSFSANGTSPSTYQQLLVSSQPRESLQSTSYVPPPHKPPPVQQMKFDPPTFTINSNSQSTPSPFAVVFANPIEEEGKSRQLSSLDELCAPSANSDEEGTSTHKRSLLEIADSRASDLHLLADAAAAVQMEDSQSGCASYSESDQQHSSFLQANFSYSAFTGLNPFDIGNKQWDDEETERFVEFAERWLPIKKRHKNFK